LLLFVGLISTREQYQSDGSILQELYTLVCNSFGNEVGCEGLLVERKISVFEVAVELTGRPKGLGKGRVKHRSITVKVEK